MMDLLGSDLPVSGEGGGGHFGWSDGAFLQAIKVLVLVRELSSTAARGCPYTRKSLTSRGVCLRVMRKKNKKIGSTAGVRPAALAKYLTPGRTHPRIVACVTCLYEEFKIRIQERVRDGMIVILINPGDVARG